MGFFWENCSDLMREKLVFVIKEIVCKFEAKDREFAKQLRSLDQFLQTLKDQTNFRNRILFKLLMDISKDVINWIN